MFGWRTAASDCASALNSSSVWVHQAVHERLLQCVQGLRGHRQAVQGGGKDGAVGPGAEDGARVIGRDNKERCLRGVKPPLGQHPCPRRLLRTGALHELLTRSLLTR